MRLGAEPVKNRISKSTEDEIIGVAESVLSSIALTTLLGVHISYILSDICKGDFRFLGASPVIVLTVVGNGILVVLLINVAIRKSIRVLSGYKNIGLFSQICLLIFMIGVPFSMSFFILLALGINPLSREAVAFC